MSTRASTTSLLPAATTHNATAAASLARRVVAARSRGNVFDGEIENDNVDEEVDDVGRAGPDPTAEWSL